MNFPKAVDKMPNLWYNYGQNMPHMPKKQKAEVQTMKRLLILCLSALLLAGCASNGPVEKDSETTGGGADTTDTAVQNEETEDTAYLDAVGQRDYGGRDFRFLLFSTGEELSWSAFDVLAEEATGEGINDAIYNRNLSIGERFNVKIVGDMDAGAAGKLTSMVRAGDSTYDASFLASASAGSAAQNGDYLDMSALPDIDTDKPYWDQSCNHDLSIGGKIYFLTGDISTIDKKATWILMFNKNLVSSFDLESPYTLVNEGRWTVDKFREMSADVSTDLNGDGTMDQADQYGLATTPDTVYGLFYSCGGRFIEKDANDLPVFSVDVDKCSSILEKTGAIMSDRNATLLSSTIKGEANVIVAIQNCFIEGRSLFYGEVMFHVNRLREMADDFGIIPMPKYDETQAHYVTYTNPAGLMLVIPKTTADVGCTGSVLEAMASLSHTTLTPAYYDNALKGKFARDNASGAMLDLIFENRVYDLTQIYGWGALPSSYNALALKGSTDLASLIAEKQEKIDTSIEKFVKAFSEE